MDKQKWPFLSIIIATANKHKQKQFVDLFAPLGLKVKGLNDLQDVPEIVEDQPTFEGNAAKKAEIISKWLDGPVISDDSGVVVPDLGGEPGVYSARYAGENATDEANNQKLLSELQKRGINRPHAFYVCVMAVAIPNHSTQLFRGECHGNIITTPQGENGFGYDPIFYLPEEKKTMAQLLNERKYMISHRAKATEKLVEWLQKTYVFST
ncbi:XTP/dITP diphosphatase [Shimazuella sp. AN120528]|uniref:XTP/dITP diphosphatase n=1 Tax=Shimazuella soli TaxID=1892854 RepID=UPI001F0F130A|nr:XTP/dITP diphosphatase [Shimazuella soli]MCH5584633.1 XTP/dITP diphosphatase [Shimazuella soli]